MKFDNMSAVAEHCDSVLVSKGLNGMYSKRLKFEINEIAKQGSDTYWLGLINDDCKFDKNPNHLVLPWLLNMVDGDPIAQRKDQIITTCRYNKVIKFINDHGKLPPEIIRDSDNPDIDIDCLPEARDPIKAYATKKYSTNINDGYGAVCSVGTWMTYLLRSAIKDVAKATSACDPRETDLLTKELPDEVDEVKDNGEGVCKGCQKTHDCVVCPHCGSPDTETPTIGRLLSEHPLLKEFGEKYPTALNCAVRLVGRIRAMGKHAGALIIADRPLFGNIPMSLDNKTKQWKSLWTEGRNTQLSKFGYTKWDILGLKNLRFIYEATRMIEQNHGISFGKRINKDYVFTPGYKITVPSMTGWDDIDPEPDVMRGGHYFTRDGLRVDINLNDEMVLQMASDAKTDAVFQFDTDLAKRTLSQSGVVSFPDLMILNAMGHPGPMAMIPDYVARRKASAMGDFTWRDLDDPRITAILDETFNTIVYQEQLQTMWQRLAGFTAPEAQEARKAVAKKWKDKLKPIKEKWLRGAGPVLGEAQAIIWWDKMETFGRYAFNRSHAVAYCLVAFRCLWLKSHFPQEWWAAVMSYCNTDKMIRYMNVARGEGVKFEPMDINKLSLNFMAIPTAHRMNHEDEVNGHIVPGLTSLKGIGAKVASNFVAPGEIVAIRDDEEVTSVDDTIGEAEAAASDSCTTATDDISNDVAEAAMSDEALANELSGKAEADAKAEQERKRLDTSPFVSVDDFVDRKGKNKLLLERLIKLGSFVTLPGHSNTKALWTYYQAKYCSGADITALKKDLRTKILAVYNWNDESITKERNRQESEFKSIYPKRKIPKSISNWQPKPDITLENVNKVCPEDFGLADILKFEEQFLGYLLHSPLDLYITRGNRSVPEAKESGELEAVITEVHHTKTRNDKPMCKLTVTDGTHSAALIIWSDELDTIDRSTLRINRGFRTKVSWDYKRRNFTLKRGASMIRLKLRDEVNAT